MVKEFKPEGYKPPSTFPLLFRDIVDGEGVEYVSYTYMKWSPESTKRRFRLYIQTLRRETSHPLHQKASTMIWHWVERPGGFRVRAVEKLRHRPKPPAQAALIGDDDLKALIDNVTLD